jgi:hypothetical protein
MVIRRFGVFPTRRFDALFAVFTGGGAWVSLEYGVRGFLAVVVVIAGVLLAAAASPAVAKLVGLVEPGSSAASSD